MGWSTYIWYEDSHVDNIQGKVMLDALTHRAPGELDKTMSECNVEVQVDREGAMRMLEAYRKKWLQIMETYNTKEINNVEDYFFARANNGGMG